jgi:hypothetical protein
MTLNTSSALSGNKAGPVIIFFLAIGLFIGYFGDDE